MGSAKGYVFGDNSTPDRAHTDAFHICDVNKAALGNPDGACAASSCSDGIQNGDETDVDQNSVCERCDAEAMREADESECEPKHQSRCEHGYCADCCGCA